MSEQVEWKGGHSIYRLTMGENQGVSNPHHVTVKVEGMGWMRCRDISDHEARALEACHGVPNLKPGMLKEAVELLREAWHSGERPGWGASSCDRNMISAGVSRSWQPC